MKRCFLVMFLVAGLICCADAGFAGGLVGGKRAVTAGGAASPAVERLTVSGTVVVDGDSVKIVTGDKTEYWLSGSVAVANKSNNGKMVTMSGMVTVIEGKKWFAVEVAKPKPAEGK